MNSLGLKTDGMGIQLNKGATRMEEKNNNKGEIKVNKLSTQEWINLIVNWTIATLASHGVSNPTLQLVVSPGFCSGGSRRTKTLGQCYNPQSASDKKTNHIFLNPRMDNSITIIGVIIHEVIHAVIGIDKKHGREFKEAMSICNLTGKPTATMLDEHGVEWANKVIEKYGAYPRPSFTGEGIKKQKTNLIKACCPKCGYTIRVTQKWINYSHPICPTGKCKSKMVIG